RSADDGGKGVMVAERPPPNPATFQPIKVESIVPGPGAARDIAKRLANSRSVVQAWTPTDWCSISARRDAPPPIDSSDKGANTSVNASNVLKSSGTASSSVKERQPDADRSEAEHDRYHRPVQHADREHGRSGNGERPGARPSEPHEFETGRECQANRRCRNAVEY